MRIFQDSTNGWTALMYATHCGHHETANCLEDYGADKNITTKSSHHLSLSDQIDMKDFRRTLSNPCFKHDLNIKGANRSSSRLKNSTGKFSVIID